MMDLTRGEQVIEQLRQRYREPQRHYHTLEHIDELLALLTAAGAHARRPERIEWAIWFHDAVYDPTRSDNEAKSADLARELLQGQLEPAEIEAIAAMVLSTADHQWRDGQPDSALFLDLDLSILGAAPARYDAYLAQVRAEYAFVPESTFRARRDALLRRWQARERLYFSDFGYARFESQARLNMSRELLATAAPT
jgi:predicted metal-dependent HD superfamily phosphohydrolase